MSVTHDSTSELVSVIVTTFNRSESLARALESLTAQRTDGEFAVEVVVVDNGSTDDTRLVVDEAARGGGPDVRYGFEPKQGLPFARNHGLSEARGAWIAFFDDDQCAAPDWLLTLYRFAKARGLSCVGGARTLVFEGESRPRLAPYCRQLLGESTAGLEPIRYSRVLLPTTGNVLVHRGVFAALGSFNETWLEGGEDTEFFNRLVASEIEAWYTPDAVVEHVIPESRLATSYLERIALRHGVTIGRRDCDDRGRWQLPFCIAARLAHGAAMYGSRLAGAKLAGDADAALAWRCRLRRVEGYLRFGMAALAPRVFGQGRFVAGLMHREGRGETAPRVRATLARPRGRIEPAEKAS